MDGSVKSLLWWWKSIHSKVCYYLMSSFSFCFFFSFFFYHFPSTAIVFKPNHNETQGLYKAGVIKSKKTVSSLVLRVSWKTSLACQTLSGFHCASYCTKQMCLYIQDTPILTFSKHNFLLYCVFKNPQTFFYIFFRVSWQHLEGNWLKNWQANCM